MFLAAASYNGSGPAARNYASEVKPVYEYIQSCASSQNTVSSSNVGQKIAAEAITRIGDPGTKYNPSDGSNACAPFVRAVIDPIANVNLETFVPNNWYNNQGKRIILATFAGSSYDLNGPNQTMSVSDLQPGDYVFYTHKNAPWTGEGGQDPHHSGIYVGNYDGPDGKGSVVHYTDGVVQLASSKQKIVVVSLSDYAIQVPYLTFLGVKRFGQ